MSETVVQVERVVIGSDGEVYRSPAAKRLIEHRKATGQPVWARFGIAPVRPPQPTIEGDVEG